MTYLRWFPDSTDLSSCEVVEDGKPYREWCVPAGLINQVAVVRLLSSEEEGDIARQRWLGGRDEDLGASTAVRWGVFHNDWLVDRIAGGGACDRERRRHMPGGDLGDCPFDGRILRR